MAPDFSRDVHCLLGLPFDAVDIEGALSKVRAAIAHQRRCFLSTPNVNWVVACLRDAGFRDSVVESDLVVLDGKPLAWVARLLNIPLKGQVAGSTMFERLRHDDSAAVAVYLFGGPNGVAESACQRLNEEHKGVRCAGFASPGFGSVEEMSNVDAIERINASGANFVLVALGARKGQAWIQRNRSRLLAPVISHLGAVVNFVAGTARRAPHWMQELGVEWMWRIREEPGLWRRYFADGVTLIRLLVTRVLLYAWFLRWHRPTPAHLESAAIEIREEAGETVICLRGAWTGQNLAPLRSIFGSLASTGKHIRLDMASTTYVDTAFLGIIVLLKGHQQRHGRRLALAPVAKPVRRLIRYSCCEFLSTHSTSRV